MKARLELPLSKKSAERALKAIKDEHPKSDRVETKMKVTSKGLEIIINSKDVTSMRAALNTVLKLLKVHEEVKKCLK